MNIAYLKHKLKAPLHLLESDAKDGSWAKDSDSCASHVAASRTHDFVSRPDSKDGSDGEVGVNDRRAIKRVESHGVSLLGSHVHNLRLLFRHGCHADAGVTKRVQKHLVSDQVDGKLLVAVDINASSASA